MTSRELFERAIVVVLQHEVGRGADETMQQSTVSCSGRARPSGRRCEP